MKFIDLFAGIGGFHYAIKDIDKNNDQHSELILASEIDKYAKIVYAKNHKVDESKILDIRDYTYNNGNNEMMKNLKAPEIIMGGFPCQTFSNAGKKMGFIDKVKGTLFFDVVTMIKKKQPKYVLLENVKHLYKHDNGNTWNTMRKTLRKMSYAVPEKPILLSPHQFGVPQIRWRVFIPAIKVKKNSALNLDINIPVPENKKIKKMIFDSKIDNILIINDKKILNALKAWGEFIKEIKRPFDRTLPVVWIDYLNNSKVDFTNMKKWRIKYIEDIKKLYKMNKIFIDKWKIKNKVKTWQKRERKLEWQAGKDNFDYKNTYVQLRQSGFRFKKPDIFPTLVAMVQTSIIFDKTINSWRYLSKNEVRKLQSFPKNFKMNIVPNYQIYKQFGNSVNVEVVKKVLIELLKL